VWEAGPVVLGSLGLVRAFLSRSLLWWFAIPIVYNTLIYLPFHDTQAYYSQPVLTFLTVFTAVELRPLIRASGAVGHG